MLFNVNQPATIPQLARLYTGDPNLTPDQVDSNLFLSSSQGRDYIHQQGQNLGIGDPAQYFSQQQLAQKMATTQNGAQAEFARQTGQYTPDSLPGQLAARNHMWDAAAGQNQQNAATIASLQQANRLKAYPLPQGGQAPNLSPVMQEDMRQQGITDPMQYLLQQRLGPDRRAVASVAGQHGAVDPEALYNEGTFQNAMSQKPDVAGRVFGALTGGDLSAYSKNYATAQTEDRKRGSNFLFDSLSKGHAKLGPKGEVLWNQMVPDPTTGRMVPSGNFAAGDGFQKSQEKYLPYVDRDISKFQALASKRGDAAGPAPVASLQNAYQNDQGVPQQLQTGSDTGSDMLRGMFGDASRVFTGGQQTWLGGTTPNTTQASQFAYGSGDFAAPQGRAVTHVRAKLADNPQFQALMQRDPAKARRLILALQMGSNSPQTATRPPSYPYMQ